ncbi:MAG: ABC transporter permease [Microthrixaceae bacterium]
MTAPTTVHEDLARRSRMRFADVVRTGTLGIRGRPGRATLTALGIAIGIGAMVAVVGISASSRADLLADLDRLGTGLLKVSAGQTVFGKDSKLPTSAPGMIRRVGPVQAAGSTTGVDASVRRSDRMPESETGGISVLASEPQLRDVLDARMAHGRFLDAAVGRFPVVVLGSVAAERLGISSIEGSPAVWLGNRWFTVIGILEPIELAPDIDRSALIGYDEAESVFGTSRSASSIWVRAEETRASAVRSVLARTANPESPDQVTVSRPSDALAAKATADTALTSLMLGLGAVALVVGGIGVANVMVISVLERRSEIGLRRALGATRSHIRAQFVVEAAALASLGGVAGVALGAVVTAAYAAHQGWRVAVPASALAAGIAGALLLGAVAGLYPAARAARLAPADAVRPS